MTTVIVDITASLERILGHEDWLDCDPLVTQDELYAIAMQLRAFRNLPCHAASCSNQNVIDPIGAWRGVEECGCRRT